MLGIGGEANNKTAGVGEGQIRRSNCAVAIASEEDLVPTIEVINSAVLAGELDAQIDAAAQSLREQF